MLRVALALCCVCAHVAGALAITLGEDDVELTRWANFRYASPVQTSRRAIQSAGQPATSGRLLISDPAAATQQPQSVWLLGVGPTEQHQQVYSSLQAGACQLLHTLPGEHLHWMVRCDAQAVEQLLGQHTHLTVAELPATHKRGDTLDAWRISTRAFSHGLKPWPSSMKDAPQDMHKYLSQQQPGQAPTAALLALLPELPAEQREALQHSLTQHISIWVQQQAQGSAATGCEQSKVQQMGPALRVVVCMQLVSEMAELLSQQPEVTWVDLEPRMVLHDLYANAVGQAPEKFTTSYPAPSVQGGLGNAASAAFYPYWQAGLDGTGEVVGVVDSGMDMDSCYLTDPGAGDYRQNPTSLTISDAGDSVDVFSSNTHRKVAQYAFFADDHDDLEGHGTHVATAIVGAPYGADSKQSPDQATDVAPGARVAMFDVGGSYGGVEGLPYYTANDQPAYNLMYDVMSQAGAKVMSNSWGTLSNSSMASVASICYLMDNYAVSHPDMLFVFSAGNDGEYYINSDGSIRVDAGGTVRAPGSCKNMLTVGAATSFFYKGVLSYKFPLKAATGPVQLQPEGFLSFANAGDLVFKFPQAQPGETGTLTYSIVQMLPNYDSGPFPLQGIDVPVIEASPADACGPLDPTIFQPYNQPVMVVFTRSARCSMSDAANNVLSNANVKGALMWYDPTNDALINNDTFEITPATGFDGKPGVQLPKRTVDVLRQSGWSVGDNAVTVTWSPPDTTGLPPTDHVASFSSYGSLYAFQRPRRPGAVVMKPDIVAPGFTLAGASDGQYTGTMDNCMAVTMQGTSMAAPQVSGGALLARQYFKKGFYPSGAANASAGFEPSGVLLKAVLIAGTAAMQGVSTATYDNLDPPPSAFQGFGRMDLASSLPLANDQLGWTIQVLDMVPIVSGDVHTYTVNVAAGQGKPLIVTMVYNDPMAYPDATSSTVNDLDLAVQALGGSPNSASSGGATSSTQTFYPNGLSAPDPANNVEKIYIGTPAASRYSITVRGKYVQPSGGQTYSLVVLGAVASRLDSPYNPASVGFTPNPRLVASPSPPGGSNIKVQGAGSVAAGPRTAALAWLAGMSALLAMLMG